MPRACREIEGSMLTSCDADFWRKRAEEARTTAETMTVPAAKREMQLITAAYDRIADRAERTAGRRAARQSA
jgi:hypothetical protein